MEDTSKPTDEKNNKDSDNFGNLSNQESINSLKEALLKHKINKSEQVKDNYKFWDTQPVPKIKSEDSDDVGPLDSNNDVENERKEPLKLPNGFSWSEIDINNDKDLTNVIIFFYF
jgi:glycylpeptide N-tetradecanoyltransferase